MKIKGIDVSIIIRGVIYAVAFVFSAAMLLSGKATSDQAQAWLDYAPELAGMVAGGLALVKLNRGSNSTATEDDVQAAQTAATVAAMDRMYQMSRELLNTINEKKQPYQSVGASDSNPPMDESAEYGQHAAPVSVNRVGSQHGSIYPG